MPGLETLIYELDGWRGLNTFSRATDKDPHLLDDCQNIDVDEDGAIGKRRGVANVTGLGIAGNCNLIYDFQSQQGFSGTTDRQRTVLVFGSTLHVVKSFNFAGQSVEATFATADALHYAAATNNGACFISNENGGAPPKVLALIGGTWRFTSAAFAPPAAAPGVAAGTAGAPTGSLRAQYTYVDVWGNETNPSPMSVTTVLTSQELQVGVVASADPTTSYIAIYVRTASGTESQLSRTISNVTQTISHTVSNATVEAAPAVETDHDQCPSGKYVVIYGSMLLVGGDTAIPDVIYPSNDGFYRQFRLETEFARAVSGDGQPVRGFKKAYNNVFIGKSDSLFIAGGDDSGSFKARVHNSDYGVLGQPSMTFMKQRLAFFSDDGIYFDNTLEPDELSGRIRNTMRQLNPANLATTPPKQYAENYKYYKQLMWSVREATGAGENDTILVYNHQQDTWVKWKGNAARCLGAIQNQDDYEFMYGGNSAGKIYQYTPPNGGSPNDDNITGTPAAISAYAETPWLNLPRLKGIPNWNTVRTVPLYIQIFVGGEPATGSTISMVTTFYTDFSTTIRGTFTTTHSAAAWPTVTVDPKMISYGELLGTFEWVKFRFANATAGEHFKLFKAIFAFKAKPAIDYS